MDRGVQQVLFCTSRRSVISLQTVCTYVRPPTDVVVGGLLRALGNDWAAKQA